MLQLKGHGLPMTSLRNSWENRSYKSNQAGFIYTDHPSKASSRSRRLPDRLQCSSLPSRYHDLHIRYTRRHKRPGSTDLRQGNCATTPFLTDEFHDAKTENKSLTERCMSSIYHYPRSLQGNRVRAGRDSITTRNPRNE